MEMPSKALYEKGDELRQQPVQGVMAHYWNQHGRNCCWNCMNYCKIPNILLQYTRDIKKLKHSKGYYFCNHCGAGMHL